MTGRAEETKYTQQRPSGRQEVQNWVRIKTVALHCTGLAGKPISCALLQDSQTDFSSDFKIVYSFSNFSKQAPDKCNGKVRFCKFERTVRDRKQILNTHKEVVRKGAEHDFSSKLKSAERLIR